MTFLVIVVLSFLFFCTPALAAEVPKEAEEILQESGVDAADAGSWSLSNLFDTLKKATVGQLEEPIRFAAQAVGYLLLGCVVALVAGENRWRSCINAVAVLGFGVMSLSAMMALVGRVCATAQESQTYLVGFVPVYSGVILLGGQTAGAAVYGGMFLSMSGFLSAIIQNFLMPVMQIYFCFSVSASLWGNKGIAEAAKLFGKLLSWLLKLCGALFSFVLGLQTVLAGNVDSAALKIGKNVLSGAVPVVGDAAAAALSSAASAIHLLKGSLALASIVVLGGMFLPALLQCVLYYLAFSCAGVVATGSGQKPCGDICTLFAEGAGLCGSVLVLYFFMVFFSTVLLLVTGNGG